MQCDLSRGDAAQGIVASKTPGRKDFPMSPATPQREYTINPKITLRIVTISLPRHAPPEVKIEGEVSVADRRIGRVTETRFLTMHLPESGRRFLTELEAAFTVPTATDKDD
jgi:hypothetical protein